MTNPTIRSKEWEGRTIGGRFPLRQWLGSSDHSTVFLSERANERVAIKLVQTGSEAEAEHRLARWRSAAELSHPNLIRIFECGRAQIDGHSYLYVVMEFADEDLSQILPQRPLAPEEVAQLLPPLLGALSYLHSKGFLHGRIKPSNVLATSDQLKLSADQIVPAAAPNSRKMRRDVYDAPETAAGIFTPASELWSVGITLYMALTQSLPEEGPKDDPANGAAIPEPFGGIVRSCLQLDPRQRRSIADMLTRLDPEATLLGREAEIDREGWRGKRIVASLFILVAAIAIAFLVFLSSRRSQPSPSAASKAPAQAQSSNEVAPTPAPAIASARPQASPKQNSPGSVSRQVLPEVSSSARNTITGKIRVVARVEVDSSGKVTHARLTTPGPSKYFARQTLEAAQRWQFSPPVVNSQPVASVWSITFRISRKQTQASPERLKH